MNKFRSGLNAGCSLLLAAGFALYLAFMPIDSAIHWLAEKPSGLEMSPTALMAIEALALIILGSLVVGALIHALSNGLGRTLVRILSFWLAGFKSGVVCLLLFLPIIIQQVLRHHAEPRVLAAPGSPVAWLYIIFEAILFISAPFWALLLIRHLPGTVLKGTLFERCRPENFDPGGEPLNRSTYDR